MKANTVCRPDSNRGKLKSTAKDRDTIRFTQRQCLGVAHKNEAHLETTSDHTQDRKHMAAALISTGFARLTMSLASTLLGFFFHCCLLSKGKAVVRRCVCPKSMIAIMEREGKKNSKRRVYAFIQ